MHEKANVGIALVAGLPRLFDAYAASRQLSKAGGGKDYDDIDLTSIERSMATLAHAATCHYVLAGVLDGSNAAARGAASFVLMKAFADAVHDVVEATAGVFAEG